MPYIITTTDTASSASRQHWIDTGEYIVNRRAVATLAEAREHVRQERIRIEDKVRPVILGEAGGTIGPLPDGTVIVVEHLPIMSLAARIDNGRDYSWGFKDAEIVAAYNAAQGS